MTFLSFTHTQWFIPYISHILHSSVISLPFFMSASHYYFIPVHVLLGFTICTKISNPLITLYSSFTVVLLLRHSIYKMLCNILQKDLNFGVIKTGIYLRFYCTILSYTVSKAVSLTLHITPKYFLWGKFWNQNLYLNCHKCVHSANIY